MENKKEKQNIIDTNAQASAFGWDFQSSLALFIVSQDLKDLKSIKVEGKTEDIEISYENQEMIYIQAKSQRDPYSSSNTNKHLQDALKTLINASQNNSYASLVYGTNIANPFVFQKFSTMFANSPTKYSFSELPDKIKEKIQSYVVKVAKKEKLDLSNFDINRLIIRTLPFFGDDDQTRYRFIKESVIVFLTSIGLNNAQATRVFENYQLDFAKNPSKSIALEKGDLTWPIVIFALDPVSDEFFEEFDLDMGEEDAIENTYSEFIERKLIDFPFINQVIQQYRDYLKSKKYASKRTAPKSFIEEYADYYEKKLFFSESNDTSNAVTKFIIWKILKKIKLIERLDKEVGL